MYLNVGVLLTCLVVILVFKNIAGKRAAEFMGEFEAEDGSGEVVDDSAMAERAIDFCGVRIYQAVESAFEQSQETAVPAAVPHAGDTQEPVGGP